MTSAELIQKVLAAKSYRQIFDNLNEMEDLFIEYIKLVHPDSCSDAGAHEASAKLNAMRDEIIKGFSFTDDAGTVEYVPLTHSTIFKGHIPLFEASLLYLGELEGRSPHFDKYLPFATPTLNASDGLKVIFENDALPLSMLPKPLPQEHVNWIVSRILELATWFHQEGYVHAGFTPDSIWVNPRTHGIICPTFYHMQKIGERLTTISAKYKGFYPTSVFTDKIADPNIDIEMIKRIAAYLLGDVSGNGSVLRKTHNVDYVNFILNYDSNSSFDVYEKYRALLAKNFPKQFIPLEV